MRISISIIAVAVLAACASDDANTTRGLALAFQAPPTAPGEEVSLVLRNGSDFQVGYNLCTARLSHQRGGQWVPVGSRGECETEAQILEPGGEATHALELPDALEGGSYRFSTRVDVGGTRVEEIYSPTFRMPEAPASDSAEAGGAGSGS